MTNLTVYRTPPQMEKRAAAEVRSAGGKAYVPTELREVRTHHIKARKPRAVPIAPGYVVANQKPDIQHGVRVVRTGPEDFDFVPVTQSSRYVKSIVGKLRTGELERLYGKARESVQRVRQARDAHKMPVHYAAGDTVTIKSGPFAGKVGAFVEQCSRRISRVQIDGRPYSIQTVLLDGVA
jgi:transcription antitermination factor NusG